MQLIELNLFLLKFEKLRPKMDDWDFEVENEFEKVSENAWFDQIHANHEKLPIRQTPLNQFELIMERLTHAIDRRATFTVNFEDCIYEDYKTKNYKKISKKPRLTVPKSPKLHTKQRFGLTKREKDGILLNNNRKVKKFPKSTRRMSVYC